MRTTTGWLDSVVRLEADFADLLCGLDEAWDWKAGALRARRAADWVGGRVLVSVVVALGTEPALVARSCNGASCASMGDGVWVTIAGGRAVGGPLALHSVERTPSDTDWRVVVAGVTAGGSVVAVVVSAAAIWRPCWAGGGASTRTAPDGGAPHVSNALLAGRESAAESGMVRIALLAQQVNHAWSLRALGRVSC